MILGIDNHRASSNSRKQYGFTLFEMLVVLVILGMTTSLVSQGLATTWQNFQRLGARDLSLSVAQLPRQWFRDTIKYSLLYHPHQAIVRGDSYQFNLVSAAVPNDPHHVPKRIEWLITEQSASWSLAFIPENEEMIVIKESFEPLEFGYLVEGEWVNRFSPQDGRLPSAVRIQEGEENWVLAVPGRAIKADIPAEMALFDEYEF